jgi:hypothetical protein
MYHLQCVSSRPAFSSAGAQFEWVSLRVYEALEVEIVVARHVFLQLAQDLVISGLCTTLHSNNTTSRTRLEIDESDHNIRY